MNSFLKVLLTNVGGAALLGLDATISNAQPTGGFAHTLGSAPGLAIVYAAGLSAAHVYIDNVLAKLGVHPAQQNPPA